MKCINNLSPINENVLHAAPSRISALENLYWSTKFVTADIKIDNFESLNYSLDEILFKPSEQTNLLGLIMDTFKINPQYVKKILVRWERGEYSTLKEFAPVAFNCLKINLFFSISSLVATLQ